MGGKAEELLRDPIELTNTVRKALKDSNSFKQECAELIEKVEKLASLLYTAARLFGHTRTNLYECPARRITAEVSKTLDKTNVLLKKCRKGRGGSGIVTRLVNMISKAPDFRKASVSLDASIGNVSWLLNVCGYVHEEGGKGGGRGMEGLPPIANMDPMLAWVWEQIALVHGGSPTEKEEGVHCLTSLATDSDRNRKLIIDEGGVRPLLKLLKEGATIKGRLASATALGTLALAGREWVQRMHDDGMSSVFIHILQEGPMKLQAKVAWAIAEMASQAPSLQHVFFDDDIVRLLVSLLIFGSIDRSNAQKVTLRSNTMHSVSSRLNGDAIASITSSRPLGGSSRPYMKTMRSYNGRLGLEPPCHDNTSMDGKSDNGLHLHRETVVSTIPDIVKLRQTVSHSRGFSDSYSHLEFLKRGRRENEDPETKRELKVEVTSALWKLARDNVKISRKITETKALICLAEMIEKETGEVRRNAVMAVMEIAASAEEDAELRRFAFKTNSRAAKSVVEQLLRIIIEPEVGSEEELLVPCVKAIGCLARTFPAKEVHIIEPLVHQLENPEPKVVMEACLALQKFVNPSNFLHVEHSKTISDSGAIHRIVEILLLVDGTNSKGSSSPQLPMLRLLCYLAQNLPSHDVFLETDTLKVLRAILIACTTTSGNVTQEVETVKDDLLLAIQNLELYQGVTHL